VSGEAPKTQVLDSGKMSLRHQGELLNGRYYLERQVGHGAMGVVWQATDVKLERQVAIKMLPEESLFPDARERLLREARAAAALNHSHIVAVYDVGEDLRGGLLDARRVLRREIDAKAHADMLSGLKSELK